MHRELQGPPVREVRADVDGLQVLGDFVLVIRVRHPNCRLVVPLCMYFMIYLTQATPELT